uniref:Uncharacterized protein n=1 Tax=Oryza glumipatula TaxID=40148 RepID=A0A0D9Y6I7_9ORYZ
MVLGLGHLNLGHFPPTKPFFAQLPYLERIYVQQQLEGWEDWVEQKAYSHQHLVPQATQEAQGMAAQKHQVMRMHSFKFGCTNM